MLFLKDFGRCVEYFRKIRNLSQEKLGEKADLHRTYIGMIERGEKNICLKNIRKISDALGVPVSEMFVWIEKNAHDER